MCVHRVVVSSTDWLDGWRTSGRVWWTSLLRNGPADHHEEREDCNDSTYGPCSGRDICEKLVDQIWSNGCITVWCVRELSRPKCKANTAERNHPSDYSDQYSRSRCHVE